MSKFKDLAPRLISGIIGAAIIIVAIYLNQWTYLTVWSVILALTLNEYYKILQEEGYNVNRELGILLGLLVFLTIFLIQAEIFEKYYYIFLMPIVYLVFIARLYQKEKKAFRNLSYFFLGMVYLALPFGLINKPCPRKSRRGYEKLFLGHGLFGIAFWLDQLLGF